MLQWAALIGFFKEKGGPYGVAVAVISALTYLAYIDIPEVKLGIVAGALVTLAVVYFVARNTRLQSESGAAFIYVQFGNQEPIELKEGHPVAYELSANNAVKIGEFTGKDRLGNPVTVESPTLTLSTEGICEIRETSDGSKYLVPLALGQVQLQLSADPIPGPEVGTVSGLLDITVVPGAAVTVEIQLGEVVPVDQIPE